MEKKQRYSWMDALRGAAIILVIHFHVLGAVGSRYLSPSDVFTNLTNLTNLVAPLRMPVLIFLSGLLVSKSILKGGKQYFSGKIKNIAYPFFIWTVILYALLIIKEQYLGEKLEVTFLQALTISPLNHLWFLSFLFIYYIATYYLRNIKPLLVFLASTILYFIFYNHIDNRFFSLFSFFILGFFIGQNLNVVSEKIKTLNPVFLLIPLSLAITFSVLNVKSELTGSNIYYLLSALFFIPVLIKFFMAIEKTILSELLEFFGVGSLVVYLVHVPAIMVVNNIMKIIYPGNALSTYIILMFLTVILCVAILYASRRFKFISLFFSPTNLKTIKLRPLIKLTNHLK